MISGSANLRQALCKSGPASSPPSIAERANSSSIRSGGNSASIRPPATAAHPMAIRLPEPGASNIPTTASASSTSASAPAPASAPEGPFTTPHVSQGAAANLSPTERSSNAAPDAGHAPQHSYALPSTVAVAAMPVTFAPAAKAVQVGAVVQQAALGGRSGGRSSADSGWVAGSSSGDSGSSLTAGGALPLAIAPLYHVQAGWRLWFDRHFAASLSC